MICDNSLLSPIQNDTNLPFSNSTISNKSLELENVDDMENEITTFEKFVNVLHPKSVADYLQLALLFLKSSQTSLSLPNVSNLKKFFIKIVNNPNNLGCTMFDDISKQTAMEIKEILQNNKQFYQFVYTYENGNCSQKEMVLKKKYFECSSNLLEQNSHDNQDSMAEDNSSKNQEDEERHKNLISSDFKHHWLATTLSFIKDNKLSTLEYPEMPEACTDFIEYIINNSNNKHDVDLPFKPLYASIWEAMTIFKLKYDFLLKSNVRSNNTVQLTLEKNPRKQDGITNKNPEVNKDTPNKSAKHLKERKKMLKKKTAVIDAVPIDFVMDSLKRIVEFLEDEFSASIVFKNVTQKEWKFLLNVKPMVRNRHILITEISPAIIDLLKRINTANLNAFSLVLSDNKFNKNKKERNVTLEKTPKYKTQTSPNNSTQLNRSISRYSPQERNEQPAFDDSSPGNKLLKALTTSSKNDDCTSVSSMEMKSQSTSSVNDIGLNLPSLKSRHTSIERRKISQKPIINFQSAGSVDLTSDENITPTKENWRSSNESVKRGRSHERRHGRMKTKLLEAMSVPLESDIGLRMMRSMGWDGGALGTRGEGIVEPIIPDLGIFKAVINIGKKVFAKGQAYVVLSRVKTLEGIALSDLKPNKVLHKPHDERALAEMQRLRGLKLIHREISGAGLGHSAVPKSRAESLKIKKKISRRNSISRSDGDENEKTATEEDFVPLTESKYEKNKTVKTRLKIFGEILELLCSDVMNKTVVFEKKLQKNEKKFLKPAIRSFNNRSKISFTIKEECDLIDKIQNEMLSNRAVVIGANFSKAGRELLLSKTINKIDLQIPIMKRLEKRTKYINDNDTLNCSQTESAPRMKILSVDKFMSSMDSMESYGVYNEKSFKALSCRLMMLEEILEFIEKDESEKAYYMDNHTINYLKFVKKFITSINARKKDKQITAIEESVAEQILNSLGNSYLVFECDRRLKQMKLKKVVYENKLMNSSKSEPTLLNEFEPTTSDLASTNKNEEVEVSQSKNVVQHDIYERVACILQHMNTKDVKKDDLNEREISNKDIEMIDLTSDNISVTSSENHMSGESDEVPKHIKELENPILKAEVDVCTSKREIKDNTTHINQTEPPISKRIRTESEKSEVENAKKIKITLVKSFKDVSILSNNKEEKMSLNLVKTVQNLISDSIDTSKDFLPLLQCHGLIDDRLVYSCYNENTYSWLRNVINDKFLLIDNAFCILEDRHKLQMKLKTVIDNDNVETILNRLKLYNSGLDTSTWTVTNKIVCNDSTVVDLVVDDNAFHFISQSNFSLFAGVDKAKFSVLWY